MAALPTVNADVACEHVAVQAPSLKLPSQKPPRPKLLGWLLRAAPRAPGAWLHSMVREREAAVDDGSSSPPTDSSSCDDEPVHEA